MNELIKINYDGERRTTSARTLWEFLDKPWTEFGKWFNQYKDYGFVEDQDYRELRIKIRTSNRAEHDAVDYEITIEMAKELCMLQKTEKGKQARQYFIELEKQWNSPELVMARALKMADQTITEKNGVILQLETKIEEQKPKVVFADAVTTSKNSVLIGELSKIIKQNGIEIGQNRLFQWMRDEGYLCKCGENYNLPTQYSMELELMEIKKTTVNNPDGSSRITRTPKITGKGQVYFTNKFLEEKEHHKDHQAS